MSSPGGSQPSPTPTSTPGIGLPSQQQFTGPWLSQQLFLASTLGLLSILSFSLLVKRQSWRGYLSPIARATGADAYTDGDRQLNNGQHTRLGRFLSALGLDWLAVTLYTSDVATAHLSGPPTSSVDTLSLLKFFRFGARLFAWMSLWAVLVLMPINWRENGWLDGVRPADDGDGSDHKRRKKPKELLLSILLKSRKDRPEPGPEPEPHPLPPDAPILPSLPATSLYDGAHLVTTYLFSILLLWLLVTRTKAFLAQHQRILNSMHSHLAARSVLIRSLPPSLRSSDALQTYFGSTLEMPTNQAWVLPDVGMGVRKLLAQREKALRDLEKAWVEWVGNPVKREYKADWKPDLIEERIRKRSARVLAGQEQLPERGWLVAAKQPSGRAEAAEEGRSTTASETTPLLPDGVERNDVIPDLAGDPSWGPPSFAAQRPTRRLHLFSTQRVDLLADLEVQFLKLDVAVGTVRAKMLQGEWKSIGVGFVEFNEVREALVASQTLYSEQPGQCRTIMAPDNQDIIWRNVGIPEPERRLRQFLISIALTLLYLFYLPPLFFLGSLLSPGVLNKYIPGFYKFLSASPRLEALVETSLPSLVLVAFNATLPMLLEATALWQGVKTKSAVELSVLKKYHLFLVTSVIFVFFITTTAFGVLLELRDNPMAILDKLSLLLPQARNFSLSYVILQSLTILPLQLLSLPIMLTAPFYILAAKTPREHAEAHGTPVFKAGTIYPQALIVATLGLLYSIVKPLVTLFALLYFCVGYIVFKYKLLFVFYPPPSSTTGQSIISGVLRPRLIFAVVLFQVFQLSLFSLHGQVLLVVLMLPLIGATLWFGRYLAKRFEKLEMYEALEGAVSADRAQRLGDDDAEQQQLMESGGATPEASDSLASTRTPSPSAEEWPTTSFDEAASEWNKARHASRHHGSATGASTPSEAASKRRSGDSSKATAAAASSTPRNLLKGKILTSASRLGRRGKASGPSHPRRGLWNTPSGTMNRSISAPGPVAIYHRPESQYTNYREASGVSEGGTYDSLPGLIERRSRFFREGRLRRSSIVGENAEEGRRRAQAAAVAEDDDEELDEDESEGEGEDEEEADTYEHPIVQGRLKQLWLPSARRSHRS